MKYQPCQKQSQGQPLKDSQLLMGPEQVTRAKTLQAVVMMMMTFFPTQNLCHVLGSVEKYGRDRQVTDDNIIWHRKDVICILEY